jgi:hypothetical protein
MGESFGDFFEEILWYSSACILSCWAGLEAYANELFIERFNNFPDLPPELANKLWTLLERKPTLDKLDMALLLKSDPVAIGNNLRQLFVQNIDLTKFKMKKFLLPTWKALLDKDSSLREHVVSLNMLRNSLTHFKPEWDNAQVNHAELSQQLTERFAQIALSPFFSEKEPIFPRRWATHGCTRWALRSCVDFLINLESRANFLPKIPEYSPRLCG